MVEDDQVFTVPEVAEKIRHSASGVYNLIREGKIKAIPLGKRLIVTGREVKRLLGLTAASPMA